MPLWIFLLSATLGLLKQLALVYTGTTKEETGGTSLLVRVSAAPPG